VGVRCAGAAAWAASEGKRMGLRAQDSWAGGSAKEGEAAGFPFYLFIYFLPFVPFWKHDLVLNSNSIMLPKFE
jgi:hypothetical protein